MPLEVRVLWPMEGRRTQVEGLQVKSDLSSDYMSIQFVKNAWSFLFMTFALKICIFSILKLFVGWPALHFGFFNIYPQPTQAKKPHQNLDPPS
jgi:hypothetical protein